MLIVYGPITLTTWLIHNGYLLPLAIWTLNFDFRTLTIRSIMVQCINYNIAIRASQLFQYEAISMSPKLISILEEWTSQEVTVEDCICQECINLLLIELRYRDEGNIGNRQLGHQSVCVCCGISLLRQTGRRSHPLLDGHPERDNIATTIEPRQMPADALACHACWHRARSNIQHVMEPLGDVQVHIQENVVFESGSSSVIEPVSVPSSDFDIPNVQHNVNTFIELNGYSRTPDTSNHCFVPDCVNRERLRVPLYLKKHILLEYKLYITPNARVCEEHASVYNWELLEEYEYTEQFSKSHIVEMLDLLRKKVTNTIDFENVENMNDHVCRYWTGLTVLNFLAIFSFVHNNLSAMCRKPKTALGVYLMKIRTGEPIRRIASLLYLNKSMACTYVRKARSCLKDVYVPLHLGINHISRAGHSSRNLIIPQGLFGTTENNPITIFDGTYVYLQKSSNYLFQKKSYSLHKYTNLVKPFLLVATDGHIIDILGPYSAITSDATIMQQLFQNENSDLREYFRPNDIFILDRGFRDALQFLTSLGYSIYKPENLCAGESQLSTDKANKSRLVTLCRWVVEVVNGRFKRDFKVFRDKYFNIASKNLMDDFKIAGAIINHFHPVLTDRPDAQIILERARQRMTMPNYLSEYVIENQLNRRRANFIQINTEIPQLNMFPMMEMSDLILFSLGVYQIKQARSYYGEHIRANGTFIVEVSDDLESVNIPGILSSHETALIRGRIKSRHHNRKIYYTYILLQVTGHTWQERICGYYCTCLIGKRTVGSCAHVMTIVWYLGWARHQNDISPPAQFLDHILIREDVENEGDE